MALPGVLEALPGVALATKRKSPLSPSTTAGRVATKATIHLTSVPIQPPDTNAVPQGVTHRTGQLKINPPNSERWERKDI